MPDLGAVSPTMQRYAAEIYRLQEDHAMVPLSELSEHVDTSLQAVSRMIRRLKDKGFLVHEPYQGVRLTEEGERIAMPALRRHRLVEVFLVRVMEYDWADAHEHSDHFALGVNDEIEDRIDALTGRPTRCPHGEPIPDKDGKMPEVRDEPLVQLEPELDLEVSRVRTHNYEKLRYFAELGLVPGRKISLTRKAPFRGPLHLLMDRQEHVIGHELACSLWVEILS